MQPLLGAVVETGNALQGKEAGDTQRNLVVVEVWGVGGTVVETARLVVVVQEGDEIVGGVAVGAEDGTLDLLAILIHSDHFAGSELALADGGEPVEQREVERSVNADDVTRFSID